MRNKKESNYQKEIIKILVDEFLIKTKSSTNKVDDAINTLNRNKLIKSEDSIYRDKLLKYYLETFFELDDEDLPLSIIFINETNSPTAGIDVSYSYYPLTKSGSQKNKKISMLILSILELLIDLSGIEFVDINTKYKSIQNSIKNKANKGICDFRKKISNGYEKMLGKHIENELLDRIVQDFNNGYSTNSPVDESYHIEYMRDIVLYTYNDESNLYQNGTSIIMKIALTLNLG